MVVQIASFFFVFAVKTTRSNDSVTSKQRDKAVVAATRARVRGDNVEDSHIWAGRVPRLVLTRGG